ncbi:MAG: carbohydrate binding domain-containing protein [Thermoguttaceae bacterium]|jgi:hypothetical protein|nr:carbohydrate binding domain-containing protein [Thermoguttaceae bacterium]
MIELQKKYARDLLTHVNPYTKTAYTQEPAIAFVEISNEDALFAVWGWGQLDNLPEPYATTFRKQWNAWLRKKYGDTAKLRAAWNIGASPLGDEMLVNGDFSKPLGREWSVERDADTRCTVSIVTSPLPQAGEGQGVRVAAPQAGEGKQAKGPKSPASTKKQARSRKPAAEGKAVQSPGRFLRIAVERQGQVAWRPQLVQAGFAVKKDTPYTLTFLARADQARRASVNCMMAHEPWERLGLSADIKLTDQWKTFRYTFVAERDDSNARISFSSLVPGTYELAGVSLRPGGIAGLEPGQTLEDDSVPVLRRSEIHLTKPARRDFIDFLWDTERDYWHGMHRFLKQELGLRALVSGTQLSYSPAHIQAGLDYIDSHSYWHHPAFPNRPWDSRDWYVHNAALVNSPGGTLARLAATRVAGMAFTVSEYNHPAPIQYAAEGFPMIAAFGAFQGWDGIYSFAYCHNTDFEPRRVDSFFDVKGDPAKLAHWPACAALFLRGDVAPARTTLLAPVPAEAERAKLHETMSAWTIQAGEFGVDPNLSLVHGVAMDLRAKGGKAEAPKLDKNQKTFVSDTGQLRWDVSQPGAGYFTADTPRTKLFTGFVRGRTFSLGEVTLSIGPTRLDWATISLVALEGKGFDQPGRVLVTATGLVENTDAQLEKLGDDRVTLRNRWGREPVLCEGVPAEVLLPVDAQRVKLYALDASGNRRASATVRSRDGKAVLELGPRHKTIWYEAEIR